MGKAIRNFKDAIAGVEEASFRKLDDNPSGQQNKTTGNPEAQSGQKSDQDSKPS